MIVTVVALIGSMSSRAQSAKSVPSLVVHGMSCSKVVCRQIKVLLHVGKPKTGARVVGFGVEIEDLLDDTVCDGWKEYFQVSSDIFGSINSRISLAVGLMLLVGDNHRAAEVEATLVELSLVCSAY